MTVVMSDPGVGGGGIVIPLMLGVRLTGMVPGSGNSLISIFH